MSNNKSVPKPSVVVDVKGEFCPVPVIETAKAMKNAESGDFILLLSTDPGVHTDMPAWCRATGNRLLSIEKTGDSVKILIEKA